MLMMWGMDRMSMSSASAKRPPAMLPLMNGALSKPVLAQKYSVLPDVAAARRKFEADTGGDVFVNPHVNDKHNQRICGGSSLNPRYGGINNQNRQFHQHTATNALLCKNEVAKDKRKILDNEVRNSELGNMPRVGFERPFPTGIGQTLGVYGKPAVLPGITSKSAAPKKSAKYEGSDTHINKTQYGVVDGAKIKRVNAFNANVIPAIKADKPVDNPVHNTTSERYQQNQVGDGPIACVDKTAVTNNLGDLKIFGKSAILPGIASTNRNEQDTTDGRIKQVKSSYTLNTNEPNGSCGHIDTDSTTGEHAKTPETNVNAERKHKSGINETKEITDLSQTDNKQNLSSNTLLPESNKPTLGEGFIKITERKQAAMLIDRCLDNAYSNDGYRYDNKTDTKVNEVGIGKELDESIGHTKTCVGENKKGMAKQTQDQRLLHKESYDTNVLNKSESLSIEKTETFDLGINTLSESRNELVGRKENVLAKDDFTTENENSILEHDSREDIDEVEGGIQVSDTMDGKNDSETEDTSHTDNVSELYSQASLSKSKEQITSGYSPMKEDTLDVRTIDAGYTKDSGHPINKMDGLITENDSEQRTERMEFERDNKTSDKIDKIPDIIEEESKHNSRTDSECPKQEESFNDKSEDKSVQLSIDASSITSKVILMDPSSIKRRQRKKRVAREHLEDSIHCALLNDSFSDVSRSTSNHKLQPAKDLQGIEAGITKHESNEDGSNIKSNGQPNKQYKTTKRVTFANRQEVHMITPLNVLEKEFRGKRNQYSSSDELTYDTDEDIGHISDNIFDDVAENEVGIHVQSKPDTDAECVDIDGQIKRASVDNTPRKSMSFEYNPEEQNDKQFSMERKHTDNKKDITSDANGVITSITNTTYNDCDGKDKDYNVHTGLEKHVKVNQKSTKIDFSRDISESAPDTGSDGGIKATRDESCIKTALKPQAISTNVKCICKTKNGDDKCNGKRYDTNGANSNNVVHIHIHMGKKTRRVKGRRMARKKTGVSRHVNAAKSRIKCVRSDNVLANDNLKHINTMANEQKKISGNSKNKPNSLKRQHIRSKLRQNLVSEESKKHAGGADPYIGQRRSVANLTKSDVSKIMSDLYSNRYKFGLMYANLVKIREDNPYIDVIKLITDPTRVTGHSENQNKVVDKLLDNRGMTSVVDNEAQRTVINNREFTSITNNKAPGRRVLNRCPPSVVVGDRCRRRAVNSGVRSTDRDNGGSIRTTLTDNRTPSRRIDNRTISSHKESDNGLISMTQSDERNFSMIQPDIRYQTNKLYPEREYVNCCAKDRHGMDYNETREKHTNARKDNVEPTKEKQKKIGKIKSFFRKLFCVCKPDIDKENE